MKFEMREVTCNKCGKLCNASVPIEAFYEYVCWDCNREVLEWQVGPLDEIEIIRSKGYLLTITIEATAPAAAHGYCGKGSTVAEAVRSLNDMMSRGKPDASTSLPSV